MKEIVKSLEEEAEDIFRKRQQFYKVAVALHVSEILRKLADPHNAAGFGSFRLRPLNNRSGLRGYNGVQQLLYTKDGFAAKNFTVRTPDLSVAAYDNFNQATPYKVVRDAGSVVLKAGGRWIDNPPRTYHGGAELLQTFPKLTLRELINSFQREIDHYNRTETQRLGEISEVVIETR